MLINKESVAIKCILIYNHVESNLFLFGRDPRKQRTHNFDADSDPMMPSNVDHNMWAQLPNEIWERILDDVDSRGLESAQETCVAWKNIVIAYALNGRLLNRAKVS